MTKLQWGKMNKPLLLKGNVNYASELVYFTDLRFRCRALNLPKHNYLENVMFAREFLTSFKKRGDT